MTVVRSTQRRPRPHRRWTRWEDAHVGPHDDRDQAYLDAGYIRCRPHGEWHRPPECAINEDGSVAERSYPPPAAETSAGLGAQAQHSGPPVADESNGMHRAGMAEPARRPPGDVPLMVIAAIGLLVFGVAVCGLLGVIGNALNLWHGWPGIEVQKP